MHAYSLDLRERALTDLDGGMSSAAVARKYRVSTRWLYKLRRQRAETGDVAPRRGLTGPPRRLAGREDLLAELVRQSPDATREESRGRLNVSVSVTTVWRALNRLGMTLRRCRRTAACRACRLRASPCLRRCRRPTST